MSNPPSTFIKAIPNEDGTTPTTTELPLYRVKYEKNLEFRQKFNKAATEIVERMKAIKGLEHNRKV